MATKLWVLVTLVPALLGVAAVSRAQEQQYVVIYIEAQPQQTNRAKQLVDDLASRSLKSAGVVNFTTLQQIDRPSFFTLVERWNSADAYQAYKASSTWQDFLGRITPLLAAPLDERPGVLLE